MRRLVPVVTLGLLVVSFFSPAIAVVVSTSTSKLAVTSSTTSISQTLQATTAPQNFTFNPSAIPNYFGTDIGKFNTKTSLSGFSWSTNATDSMTLQPPSVGGVAQTNSLIYFNSTITSYQFSGVFGTLNLFFKPSQYSVKISIQTNLASPQSVCIPFSASSTISQETTTDLKTGKSSLLPSVRAGNEIFKWSDINPAFSPSWNGSLCINLPSGITNIDPLAIDGSGQNNWSGGTSKTCTLSTTSTNDVIIVMATGSPTNTLAGNQWSASDTAGLSPWTQRAYKTITGVSGLAIVWFYAISAGALSGDVITVSESGLAIAIFNGQVVCFGVSGANTSTPFDTNGAIPCTNTAGVSPYSCTISTSNSNDLLFGGVIEQGGGGLGAPSQGGSWIDLSNIVNTFSQDVSVLVVSSTQSSSVVTWTGDPGNAFVAGVDAIQQAAGGNVNALFVLKVDTVSHGEILIPLVSPITISSSSTFTMTTGITNTITIEAQEFSGYIWNGYSGATTWIQDTVNPTQTVTYSNFTTTTLTSTLTASFTAPGGGGANILLGLFALGIIIIFTIIALSIGRRRW